MSVSFYSISKEQKDVIKGIAMVFIVLHNFLHWTNAVGENEMSFDPNRIYNLFEFIGGDVTRLFNGLFSYFGFYFLELFIFISGYGLAKYSINSTTPMYKKYIIPRIIKLYALLIFGIIVYFFLFYRAFDMEWFTAFVTSSLLMYNNLSFYRIFMFIGPWWYFSLIFQLYILFPLLYKALDRYKEKGFFVLIALSYVLIFLLTPIASKWDVPIYGNFLGHLPEFLLGMGCVMFERLKFTWKVMIPAMVVFILSNFLEFFFPFSFLSATILMLWFFHAIINMPSNRVMRAFKLLGVISMFMFLINGPLRLYTMPYLARGEPLQVLLGSFIHLTIVIMVSYMLSLLYYKTVEPLSLKLISKL